MSSNIALPETFEENTRQLFGDARYARFREALNLASPATIRLNPFKRTDNEAEAGVPFESIPWCPEGRMLSFRPDFTFDPLLHAGVYYVQESSSMFVSHVVRHLIDRPVKALDLCAAPGGKTTTLRASLPAGSVVVANEPVKVRASILSENVQKQGHPDMLVTNNYPRDFRKADIAFDLILADVPCSGEGMFRKDPQAIREWSPQNVEKCAQLQRSIIEDIWPVLRPGGYLIYSTCTFNRHENEENVRWIASHLGAVPVDIPVDARWNITGALDTDSTEGAQPCGDTQPLPVYRFIPGFTPGEGLFMAVLQKPGTEAEAPKPKQRKPSPHVRQSVCQKTVQPWLRAAAASAEDGWTIVDTPTTIRAIAPRWLSLYDSLSAKLHVIHAGVGIGVAKGKSIVPSASLALSTVLDRNAFPQAEIGWEQAMLYLRKEAITLPADTPHGLVLLTFRNHPIGFCKNLGNRANNLYPQEWKIKTTHLPEQAVCVL